ncbi:MAG: MFS transporter [Desulfobacterales bacterium]|jgi:MFS family permease|nr:MFS transporter [Desulfobacterales bacterium]
MNLVEPTLPRDDLPSGDRIKGIYFIAISQFGIAFSFNCILSFMPFYILKVSPYGAKETMVWIGMILGSTSLVAALAAPFWGSLTARVRPKLLFEGGILCNGLIFLVMGFVENLPLLLALRLIQGALGAISTIGLVLIAASAPKHALPRYLGLFQNSMTAGQLIGPPLGAYAVTLFGYHAPFIIAVVVVSLSAVYCHRHVRDIPVQPKPPQQAKPLTGGALWGWGLAVVGTIHLMFLPSVLPQILEGFQLTAAAAITSAGTIMMLYMAAAFVGNYLLVALASRLGSARVITLCCLSAALLQALLYLSTGVYSFTLIRVLQTGSIAAVIPLVIAIFAGEGGSGTTLGFLNSGRFVGNALGPMMATALLAHFGLLALYLTIAGLTIALLAGFRISMRKGLLPRPS